MSNAVKWTDWREASTQSPEPAPPVAAGALRLRLFACLAGLVALAVLLPGPSSWPALLTGESSGPTAIDATAERAILATAGVLVWAALCWVLLVVGLASLGRLPGRAGQYGRSALTHLAPAVAGRLIAGAVGISLLAGTSACAVPAAFGSGAAGGEPPTAVAGQGATTTGAAAADPAAADPAAAGATTLPSLTIDWPNPAGPGQGATTGDDPAAGNTPATSPPADAPAAGPTGVNSPAAEPPTTGAAPSNAPPDGAAADDAPPPGAAPGDAPPDDAATSNAQTSNAQTSNAPEPTTPPTSTATATATATDGAPYPEDVPPTIASHDDRDAPPAAQPPEGTNPPAVEPDADPALRPTDGQPSPADATRGQVTVRQGDTLWSIAGRRLSPGSTDLEIDKAWRTWYSTNVSVIGADPDLILPGQQLLPPDAENRN